MLRDEIRKSDDIAQTKLLKNLDFLKTFNDSFNYAVILLGAFFGFRKFYDIYYEVLNLRFYKDFKTTQMQPIKEEQQEKVDTILETDNSVKTVTEEEQPKEEQPKEEQLKEEQTENKNEEIATITIPEKEPNLDDKPEAQFEEKKDETEVKEVSNDSNTQQNDTIKDDSKEQSIIKEMIEQALHENQPKKLSVIAEMIKKETGKKVQIGFIEKVAKQMNGIELIIIGKAKGVMRTT
jgi:hypothetical protein